MTKQEQYNFALTKIREQGVPSVDEKGSCKYRSDEGDKCAVGHFISNELYSEEMEGKSLKHYLLESIIEEMNLDKGLVADLQQAHDDAAWEVYEAQEIGLDNDETFMVKYERKMIDVADKWGLDYTPAE